jgi:hypothetical protein
VSKASGLKNKLKKGNQKQTTEEGSTMERIKRFLLDESGTAEVTSEVLMIAGVAILVGAALAIYYGAAETFFSSAGSAAVNYAGRIGPQF